MFDELLVAADDPEIVRAVEGFGGRAALTRKDHSSGTERVAEVARGSEFSSFGCIVNLQGDEPFLPASSVAAAIARVGAGWDVGTAAVRISSLAELRDPSAVKVVLDDRGSALYFSRAPIPHDETAAFAIESAAGGPWLRHVGVYAFSAAALIRATELPSNPLEELEALEQLRWLAAGLRIGVAVVEGGSPGIDTEEDLKRAEEILSRREEFP